MKISKSCVRFSVCKIAFNNNHFCEYAHRISKDIVNYIVIGGEVIVSDIRVGTNAQVPRIGMEAYIPQAVTPVSVIISIL